MSVHRLFLLVWLLDLALLPILAVLQLGFSFSIVSNYYARFSYIAVLALAVSYHLLSMRRPVLPSISFVFIGIMAVGATKGVLAGQLNREFVAHIFYCTMPIIMTSYGWHFMTAYQASSRLRRWFRVVMYCGFYLGVLVTAAFLLGAKLGLASYDALGIWNFFFAGPYLAYQTNGAVFLAASIIGAALGAKRSTLVVFVVYALLYFLLMRKRSRRVILLVAPVAVAAAVLVVGDSMSLGESRFAQSIGDLSAGDIDAASANRWAESASAIRYLSERASRILFGAGFGGTFQPWPDKPDYANYFQHYTHFGVISYLWIGGIFAPIAIYAVLGTTAIRLLFKARRRVILRQEYFFVLWLCGILTVSLFGAVLMNNSYLWFVIGCCLHLNASSSSAKLARVPT
jgi:hypothetical protein